MTNEIKTYFTVQPLDKTYYDSNSIFWNSIYEMILSRVLQLKGAQAMEVMDDITFRKMLFLLSFGDAATRLNYMKSTTVKKFVGKYISMYRNSCELGDYVMNDDELMATGLTGTIYDAYYNEDIQRLSEKDFYGGLGLNPNLYLPITEGI